MLTKATGLYHLSVKRTEREGGGFPMTTKVKSFIEVSYLIYSDF